MIKGPISLINSFVMGVPGMDAIIMPKSPPMDDPSHETLGGDAVVDGVIWAISVVRSFIYWV